MTDIITFRASPEDKAVITRILRENPNLRNNVSAAIRTGLVAYQRYQDVQQASQVGLIGAVFAHELADNYQILLDRSEIERSSDFNQWLVGFTYKPVDESFPKALVEGRTPLAACESKEGSEGVAWYLVGDVIVGQGSGDVWHWYLVPVSARNQMPGIVG